MQKNENGLFAPQNTAPVKPQEEFNSLDTEKAEIKVVITTYDNCLVAYPWLDWLKLEEQFTKIANPSSNVRAFRRLFIGGAEEQSLDAQGRIRLSQEHREYAHLDKEITIVGLTNRFEIWNPTLLKQGTEEIDFNAVSAELNDSGIDFAL
jgi:MraZ protein